MKYIAALIITVLALGAAVAYSEQRIATVLATHRIESRCMVVNGLCIIDGKVIVG